MDRIAFEVPTVSRDPIREAWLAALLGALAFTPGFHVQVAGEDPIFYVYEALVLVAGLFAARSYWMTHEASPVRGSTLATVAVAITFIAASALGAEPLLSLGIARVTIEAALLAWSVPALIARFDRRSIVWAGVGALAVHGALFIAALGGVTEGTYRVTLTVRNEVRMLGGSLNSAASQFVMLLPLAVVGLAFPRKLVRTMSAAGVGLASWGIVISESRALAGGLAVVAGAFIIGVVRDTEKVGHRIRIFGFLFAVGVLVAGFTPQLVDAANLAYDGIVSILTFGDSGGGVGEEPEPPEDVDERNESSDLRRRAAWDLAMEDFLSNPILGTGFRQRFLEGARKFFAHNFMFENLAGTGTLGTLSFLALIGVYSIGWFRSRWGYARIVIASGVIAGLSIALVQPFLNTSHHFAGVWWVMLAIGASSSLRLPVGADETPAYEDEVDP